METLRIALEWFLNPDHLPLLAARDHLRERGLSLDLVVPDDHYDGFDALAAGQVDLVVNEPLHLVERRALKLVSHGCFFATDGGVLMHAAALDRLADGGAVRIASPVSTPTTNGLCRDILAGWMTSRGRAIAAEQVAIEPAGFAHVDNLAAGYDGAWLAFANVEGISATMRGIAAQLVTTAEAGIPNFSALELIGAANADDDVRARIARLVDALNTVIPQLRECPELARSVWYASSGDTVTPEGDAIVEATLQRLISPVAPDIALWAPMWHYLHTHGGDVVDKATFDAIFA